MNVSPVVVFAYNRPSHLRETLSALAANELAKETPVYVYIDGPKSERDHEPIRKVQELVSRCADLNIVECVNADQNRGLSESVIAGVSSVVAEHGSVIVLEDDLVTSPHFLSYMNSALNTFSSVKEVMSVSAYGRPGVRERLREVDPYDAYFVPRNSSWGWGTWHGAWELADWGMSDYPAFRSDKSERKRFAEAGSDLCLMLELQQNGLIDSWAIRWTYAHFRNNGVSLVPYESYVRNIGFDGSGTHCGNHRWNKNRVGVDVEIAKAEPKLPDSPVVRDDVLSIFRGLHHQRLLSQAYWRLKLLAARVSEKGRRV